MPTFIKVGYESRNINSFTSRGYFIKRIKETVTRKWGAITISGHSYKKIKWEKSYPKVAINKFKTIEQAENFARSHILRRFNRNYEQTNMSIK